MIPSPIHAWADESRQQADSHPDWWCTQCQGKGTIALYTPYSADILAPRKVTYFGEGTCPACDGTGDRGHTPETEAAHDTETLTYQRRLADIAAMGGTMLSNTVARDRLTGHLTGAVTWLVQESVAAYQYGAGHAQLAPLHGHKAMILMAQAESESFWRGREPLTEDQTYWREQYRQHWHERLEAVEPPPAPPQSDPLTP